MEISVSTYVLFGVFSVIVTLAVDYAVLWIMSHTLDNRKDDVSGDADQ